MSDVLKLILTLLKGTMFEPIAAQLEKALTDGRITIKEGADIVEAAVPMLEAYFPKDKLEIEFGKDLIHAAANYFDAKAAQAKAKPAPPPPAAKKVEEPAEPKEKITKKK